MSSAEIMTLIGVLLFVAGLLGYLILNQKVKTVEIKSEGELVYIMHLHFLLGTIFLIGTVFGFILTIVGGAFMLQKIVIP